MALPDPIVDIPMSDGSGTTAVDYAATPHNGAYVGSPSLVGDSGAYTSGDPITCMESVTTAKHMRAPSTAGIPFVRGVAKTIVLMFQSTIDATAAGALGGFPFISFGTSSGDSAFTTAWSWPNSCVISFRKQADGFPSQNFISVNVNLNAGGYGKAAGYNTSAGHYDEQPHTIAIVYTPNADDGGNGGTIKLYYDGDLDATYGTVTGVDAFLPTSAYATPFGIGAVLKGTDGSPAIADPATATDMPFRFFGLRVFNSALSASDITDLPDEYNGNPNLMIEERDEERFRDVLEKMAARHALICPFDDSNGFRNYVSDRGDGIPVLDQGHVFTLARMFRAALGGGDAENEYLAGFGMGANSPMADSLGGGNTALGNPANPTGEDGPRGYLGIQLADYLLGNYITAHGSMPAGMLAEHLGEWNRNAEGGNNPFTGGGDWGAYEGLLMNARSTGAGTHTAAGSNSKLEFNTSHGDWPFAPTAYLQIRHLLSNVGLAYPHVNVGGTIVGEVSHPGSGVAAWQGDSVCTIGTAINGTTSSFYSLAKTGSDAVGELWVGHLGIYDTRKGSGAVLIPFWAKGAFAGCHAAESMIDSQTTLAKVAAFWSRYRARSLAITGKLPIAVVVWQHGGNDPANPLASSWTYTPKYDEAGAEQGAPSGAEDTTNTAAKRIGYRQNMATCRDVMRDGWIEAGGDPDDFYFICGPYHAASTQFTGWSRQVKARAERELADAHADTMRLDGRVAVTQAEYDDLDAYADPGDSGRAHLTYIGWKTLADRLGLRLSELAPEGGTVQLVAMLAGLGPLRGGI